MFRLRATYFARVVASSQSLLRSHPPDGDFSLRSLAPPIHGEPAALGFAVRRERAKRRLETKVSKAFLLVLSGGAATPSGAVHWGLGPDLFRCRWAGGEDLFPLLLSARRAGAFGEGVCREAEPP